MIKALRCSFCGKGEHEVARLVAGAKALICDECVAKASRIMQQSADQSVAPIKQDSSPEK